MATREERFKKIENIVISGISGVFPQCDNIEEFKQSLLDGKNLIKDNERWGTEVKNIPRKVGYIETVDRFDYSFFRVHRKQAEQMSISARMLLEKTFEAIVDAGYNPEQLKSKNIGVFFGAYDMEAKEEKSLTSGVNEFTIYGPSQCLVANRISYWLDINGPSMAVDTACSSFSYVFECAYKSIQNGDCEGALVCAANVGISPYVSHCFALTGLLDAEGISRPFDAEGSTYSYLLITIYNYNSYNTSEKLIYMSTHGLCMVEENRTDMEFIRLLHEVFSDDISGHLNRGYIILDKERTLRQHQKIFSGEKRPIWFIFSGMGSQWPSMGNSLMQIPLFAESIHKSNNILRSKDVDLIKIITKNDPQIFNNILNSFVGIAAIQVNLRSLSNTTNNIPLTLKNHENNAEFLLNAIGQLYEVGCISKISKLYPPVQFPVSRSTPMISPLIEWQHDEIWPVTKFSKKVSMSGERDIIVDLKIEDYAYLRDHVVDGKNLYPALGYLALVWETVAMIREQNYKTLSVVFENVSFERATYVSIKNIIIFHIIFRIVIDNFEKFSWLRHMAHRNFMQMDRNLNAIRISEDFCPFVLKFRPTYSSL